MFVAFPDKEDTIFYPWKSNMIGTRNGLKERARERKLKSIDDRMYSRFYGIRLQPSHVAIAAWYLFILGFCYFSFFR